MNKSIYSQKEELILQSTLNAVFLFSICNAKTDLLSSNFFKNLDFIAPKVKDVFSSQIIQVDNQGMLLICLYSLVVLPKELLDDKIYPIDDIDKWINDNGTIIENSYHDNEHLRHIRNAISHGRIEIIKENDKTLCKFNDQCGSSRKYCLKMDMEKVLGLLFELIKSLEPFFNDMAKKGSTTNNSNLTIEEQMGQPLINK